MDHIRVTTTSMWDDTHWHYAIKLDNKKIYIYLFNLGTWARAQNVLSLLSSTCSPYKLSKKRPICCAKTPNVGGKISKPRERGDNSVMFFY